MFSNANYLRPAEITNAWANEQIHTPHAYNSEMRRGAGILLLNMQYLLGLISIDCQRQTFGISISFNDTLKIR